MILNIKKVEEKLHEIILLSESISDVDSNRGSFFSSGLAGSIFLLSQYKIDYKTNQYDMLLKNKIEEFVSIDLAERNVTFCEGITGYAWLLNYLIRNKIIELDITDFFVEIDLIIYQSSMNLLKYRNHDFLHGTIGNLFYLIDRDNLEDVRLYIEEILIELSKQSLKSDKGISWAKIDEGKEIIDLGLSHGLASKIVIFSKLIEKNILPNLVKEMLFESVRFILNSKNSNLTKLVFPGSLVSGVLNKDNSCGIRWCYGDLGISLALMQAGEALHDAEIKKEAIEICLKTIDIKDVDDTLIKGVDICHGSSGAAHLYNRMYQYTKDKRFKRASNYWINETLSMASGCKELAGYEQQYRDFPNNNLGFLTGLSGVGLVLLSAISNKEPIWDRCLLIS